MRAFARDGDAFAAARPVHPMLFALYPVLRLYSLNMNEVSIVDTLMPLLVVLGATAAAWAALTLLFRDLRRAAIVTSAGVIVVMLYGLVESELSPEGDLRPVLLAGGVAIIIAAFVLAWRLRDSLARATLGLNVISLVLVVLVAIPTTQGVAAELTQGDAGDDDEPVAVRADGSPARDIYHLVLDRYGSEASLRGELAVDNAAFVAWLREQGFDVVDDAYANYTKTTLSVGSTLSMRPVDDIAEELGPGSGNLAPVVRRIRNSRAGRFLQEQGYEYVHLGSWFNQTRDSRIADLSFNPETEVSFGTTLYDQTVLPVLVDRPPKDRQSERRHADAAEYQFAVLEELAEQPGPRYVLAHILLPHAPYVFLEDGTFDADAATFETQLAYLNRWLQGFIEPLLERPEAERPIIVLQGDEGPYPDRFRADQDGFDWSTASDEELVTKFGILNAMYLPGPEGDAPLPAGLTAVNTYPELFARYFGADVPRHPDRVTASTRARPYDLLDVTDRLRATEDHAPAP
jgi:hypothetical protein